VEGTQLDNLVNSIQPIVLDTPSAHDAADHDDAATPVHDPVRYASDTLLIDTQVVDPPLPSEPMP
jgi:hypothetical protein